MKSTRRSFLKGASLGALTTLLPKAARAGTLPNIVFILADDLGWADVGFHGSKIKTPNLDRLAAGGIRLENHYVAPTCTPSRVGLMTGRYPSRFGVLAPAYGKIFDDDTVTVASALASRGYDTAITGKWHMGSPPDCTPRQFGFRSSHGYFHGQIDPYSHLYKTGEANWHRNDVLIEEQGHATDLLTGEAVRIIETPRVGPLFLYVPYSVPHYPLKEPPEWAGPYEEVFEEPSRRWYAASITHMDAGIGRIVDALDRCGLRGNTLIVFSSDNGGQPSWHSDTEYGGTYADLPHTVMGINEPLRGHKTEVYEGGIRVPALVNWPGKLKPGLLEHPLKIVDWMPTFCALTGYKPERDLEWDGSDVWDVITGENNAPAERTFYWKTPSASAVRQGDWKLLKLSGDKFELYNIAKDPYEKRDMLRESPERVEELKALLARTAAKDRSRK